MAVPTVAVVQPKRSGPAQEIVLPANVQAFADAPIYARTNGYLKRWYVDIGGRVKAGQLLAEIDTPEVTSNCARPAPIWPRRRPTSIFQRSQPTATRDC